MYRVKVMPTAVHQSGQVALPPQEVTRVFGVFEIFEERAVQLGIL